MFNKPVLFIDTAIVLLLMCFTLHTAGQTCSGTWGTPIINQTFGHGQPGTYFFGPLSQYAPGTTTSTNFIYGSISDNYSCLTQNATNGQPGGWINVADHTGDPQGLMFLINAPSTAATVFFEYTMNNLCPNTVLQLSVWILNVNPQTLANNSTYQYPNMQINLVDVITGNTIATTSTGNVAPDQAWHNYTLVFNNVTSTDVKMQLVNYSVGSGYGNDLALDDITVRPCVPATHILPKVDTVICKSSSFSFTANISGSVYTVPEYNWQYSKDSGRNWQSIVAPSTSATSCTFTPLDTGSYWVRFLTGPVGFSSNTNCSAVSDAAIIRMYNPSPMPVTNDVTLCAGSVSPSASSLVTGNNVKWYTSAIGGTGSSIMPVINMGNPGVITLYVTQMFPLDCESDRAPIQITLITAPVTDFSYTPAYGCLQDTILFKDNSMNIVSRKWEFGDGVIDTTAAPVHIYKQQGNYAVTLYTTNNICNDSDERAIVIKHPLAAIFTVSPDSICLSQAVIFNNISVATGPNYHWNFGDSTVDINANPTYTYKQVGIYDVTLIVTDFIGCGDTAMQTVFVDSLPSLSVTGDSVECVGKAISLHAIYKGVNNTNIAWVFDNGLTIHDQINMIHAYDKPGIYTIKATIENGLCSDTTVSKTITIYPYPLVDIGPDTAICPSQPPVSLSNLALNAGTNTSLWNTGDVGNSITAAQPGIYWLQLTTQYGCATTDTITIANSCYVAIPNAFSPNDDGVNDYFFPRSLLSKGVVSFHMEIFNRWGQLFFETDNINGRGWNGKFSDIAQPPDVYVYLINATFINGTEATYQGNITLIR